MARSKQSSPTKESPGTDVQRRAIKACQRCRLKKCKLLERQQLQMSAGIQELYQRLRNNEAWTSLVLEDDLGPQPLTHKILETLGILPGSWDEIGLVKNDLYAAPQPPFDVEFSNSLPRFSECSPSYGASDGSLSTPVCSSVHGANEEWTPTPDYPFDYGANDGWMLTPESDIVCTESLHLAHADHMSPTTDDPAPLSTRRKVDLSLQLTPLSTSPLIFGHPSNIPFHTGVM